MLHSSAVKIVSNVHYFFTLLSNSNVDWIIFKSILILWIWLHKDLPWGCCKVEYPQELILHSNLSKYRLPIPLPQSENNMSKMNFMDGWDVAIFEIKMSFGRVFYIVTVPRPNDYFHAMNISSNMLIVLNVPLSTDHWWRLSTFFSITEKQLLMRHFKFHKHCGTSFSLSLSLTL